MLNIESTEFTQNKYISKESAYGLRHCLFAMGWLNLLLTGGLARKVGPDKANISSHGVHLRPPPLQED